MGGYGSGRWFGHDKKATVEDYHYIDVGRMQRDGVLIPWFVGTVTWSVGGRPTGSIGFRVEPQGADGRRLVLDYLWGEAKEHVVIPVALEATRPQFGGVRWWYRCPLAVNAVACNRRVAKLYIRGRYFGCRHCHKLTYKSCQESHQLDSLYATMAKALGWPVENVRRILQRSARDARRH